jgi:hypothetical protein
VVDFGRPPSFTGLVVHRDPVIGYSLLLPEGWHRSDLEAGDGVFFAPTPDDRETGLEVAGRDLGFEVQPGDLATIERGFLAGLQQLANCQIESREAESIGRLLTLEARLTFREGDTLRKRWVRQLYQGRAQIRVVAQGASPEAFGYWEPMFTTMMRTVRFGDWWAEVIGVEWAEKAFKDLGEDDEDTVER